MKRYWLINLICIVLSAGFLFGMVWVWRGTDEIDYEAELRIANSKIENVKIKMENNVARVNAALPPQYFISVPFTSQAPEKNWEQPWQDACEEAAVLMLDAYYKNYNLSPLFAKDEILKIIKWEEERGWGSSIEIEKVRELVERFVLLNHTITTSLHHARIVNDPTVENIKKFVANGQPVLVVADGKVLPNPHFRNGGPVYHALIIRGYTETEFITNDPGTQFGRGFKYKYKDLLNAIHDWNGGDVKNGKRAVLVVE
ncbi:MAG: hypothetical protein A2921_02880 [Candidatus Magasanikbacteria bacterium RIFCSPLOWO2_01_FULL_43_20b]|uniref:Peptidase C39-like domain-containing protein n=1 Tax=Candidatus Magasanikbacteria bacterium RIFCSPLOWO2_12_FULL_43_12 TaxID=1798692 RepID=A0A1F6MTH8_9BACT|nr:MAG: hypothetical protein A3C74_00765 [Candidatus Magasanikbacteria bacterium RIFCSPHIGHO2_02_FULL_44_13]OGH72725.1 MAG: hypothetical protein A3I93_04020 [Candidatus Magasanikbacteria bacterium RIFCSPLOWO2_02_FULL_43_22]OGH72938.1 MAG: hypothetical protein A2921_02880 [Candidatus Magasanikbacteria bacterium RIFCSPLOWO2_01_FULL_43_20b]OGH74979.1 MAG: hypothetical protein A3G00_01350 [Candidatus Magasanikbacteria bacterium RIFCSPLOWO2_12_FULL_43_12]